MTGAVPPDRCPGVLRLHPAADGGLARVRLPGGRIDASGLRAVADAALAGNGVIELTSRAGLQIRGLDDTSAEHCAVTIAAAGLLPSPSHERVRNILASPVAGRHPRSLSATDNLVVDLDHALQAAPVLAELSGRFLFGVDDGTRLLGEHAPDVALVARARDEFGLHVRGADTGRAATAATAAALAVEAARGLMEPDAPAPARPSTAGRRLELGTLHQRDGRIAVTVMPRLARVDVSTLRALAALAGEHRTDIRLSAHRTLTLPDLDRAAAPDVSARLRALGLIDDPASGWNGLSACAGLGACAMALCDVRGEAQRRAGERAPGAPPEHWAACERRCGRPGGHHVAYIATPQGVRRETVDAR